MIKADTIKNLTDNTLVTISNGVFSLPATSHDDHHASQILQVKSYSDQTNTDRGVQNSKWTNIYSTPPMDFRLQKKDSYIYIQVFFTHRTVLSFSFFNFCIIFLTSFSEIRCSL